jgi:hypothetical protein
MLKVCFACKKELDTSCFGINNGHKDGLQSCCLQCKNARERDKYSKMGVNGTQSNYKIAKQRRVAQARQVVLDWYKSQLGCKQCGETRIACLEANHIDPATKQYTISQMVGRALSEELIKKELAKCECLCSNCHQVLTAQQFGWYKNLELLEEK